MKLEEITQESLRKLEKTKIRGIHNRVHQVWGNFKGNQKDRKNLVTEKHSLLVAEMFSRGYNHNMIDTLDDTLPDHLQRMSKSKFPSYFVWIPDFISISGGAVYGKDRMPDDIDVIVRSNEFKVVPDKSFRVKVDRICEALGKKPVWVAEEEDSSEPE